jgi:hypothetical protein
MYIENIINANGVFSVKILMVFIVALSLFVTLGCNYDYGKYGKDKTDSKSEQKNDGGAPSN